MKKQIERLKDCWKAAKEAASYKKKRAYSYADGYLDGIVAAQTIYEQGNKRIHGCELKNMCGNFIAKKCGSWCDKYISDPES